MIYLKKCCKKLKKKCPEAIPIQATAAELPLKDESMDILVSRGIVVSHLPPEMSDNFFNEIGRIVKSGGLVLFDFLTKNTSKIKDKSIKSRFTKKQIEEQLLSHGFENIEFDGDNSDRVMRVKAIKK